MISTRVVRRNQRKHQINGFTVNAFKCHRVVQSGKQAIDAGDRWQATVGNGNTLAQAGRSQFFSLQQCFKNHSRINGDKRCQALSHFLQQLFFVLNFKPRQNGAGINDVGKCHCVFNPYSTETGASPSGEVLSRCFHFASRYPAMPEPTTLAMSPDVGAFGSEVKCICG